MNLKIVIAGLVSSLAFGQFASIRPNVNGETMAATFSPPEIFIVEPTGAPYSGEWISEHVQTLADGTHISRILSREKIWRDSQGRRRTEQKLGVDAVFFVVEIRDPIAGFMYVIDDQQAIAHRFAISSELKTPRSLITLVPAKPATASTFENLGTQDIEGVPAKGTRSTRTIPIGEIGNDGPITTSSEAWFSRDLGLIVLSKRIDQSGERTTRLTQIDKSEPDPTLFMAPPGYTVVDEKDTFTMALKRQ